MLAEAANSAALAYMQLTKLQANTAAKCIFFRCSESALYTWSDNLCANCMDLSNENASLFSNLSKIDDNAFFRECLQRVKHAVVFFVRQDVHIHTASGMKVNCIFTFRLLGYFL